MTFTATYSPQDNKLRLSASERLDTETYALVKSKGFIWAPKQAIFVAPMWTPGREDFLLTLVDMIEDEESTTEERAAQRAERFENYSVKRASEAESTYNHVSSISDNIPFGQPILIGHHSQRKAEKDAKRIEDGMRKTVKLWETSNYWEERAKSSKAHARYLERDDVRHRRIKKIEAELRGYQRDIASLEKRKAFFSLPDLTQEVVIAAYMKGTYHTTNEKYIKYSYDSNSYEFVVPFHEAISAWLIAIDKNIIYHQRWVDHCNNRLSYERAMLGDYEAQKTIRKKPITAPIVNYPGEGFLHMTKAEWTIASKRSDSYFLDKRKADGTDWNQYSEHRDLVDHRLRYAALGFAFKNSKHVYITDMPIKYPEHLKEQAHAV